MVPAIMETFPENICFKDDGANLAFFFLPGKYPKATGKAQN